jgi:hypothetical protein
MGIARRIRTLRDAWAQVMTTLLLGGLGLLLVQTIDASSDTPDSLEGTAHFRVCKACQTSYRQSQTGENILRSSLEDPDTN